MSITLREPSDITMLADSVQALSQVTTPVLAQEGALNARDLQSATTVSTPTFTEAGNWIKPSPGWPTSRSKLEWPWSAGSIYNQSIGEDANYVWAQLNPPDELNEDTEYWIPTTSSDPIIESRACNDGLGCWQEYNYLRCNGDTNVNWNWPMPDLYFNFPPNIIIPSEAQNNIFTVTTPDQNGTRSAGGSARCVVGGPIYSNNHGISCVRDIKGDMWDVLPDRADSWCDAKLPNGYGGSKVPHGLILRDDDWVNDDPIKHTLSFSFSGWQLYMNRTTQTCESRWPATWCDNWWNEYNNDTNCTGTYSCYIDVPSSHVYANRMGALYAIPRTITPTTLQVYTISRFQPYYSGSPQNYSIQTAPGQKLFDVLQDYGAYATNTCLFVNHWCRQYVNATLTSLSNFEANYGHPFIYATMPWASSLNPPPNSAWERWMQDVKAIWQNLYIVDNNTATTIGGPGVRRMRPPAPPFND